MLEYLKQAENFLNKTNTTLKVEYLKNDFYFHKDEDKRDIYKVTLTRGNRNYTFNFGNSLVNSQHYQDKDIKNRSYTMTGKALKGNYKIDNMDYAAEYCNLVKGTAPNAYDILVCLQKYDVGSLENFCSEFGYDTYSKKVEKIYKSVCEEYEAVCRLYSDEEIEELQEIQ